MGHLQVDNKFLEMLYQLWQKCQLVFEKIECAYVWVTYDGVSDRI